MRDSDSEIPFLAEVRPGYDEPRINRPVRRRRNHMKFLVAVLIALLIVAVGLGAAIYIQTTSPQTHARRGGSGPGVNAGRRSRRPRSSRPLPRRRRRSGAPPTPTARPRHSRRWSNRRPTGTGSTAASSCPTTAARRAASPSKSPSPRPSRPCSCGGSAEDGKGGFVSTWQTPTDIFVGRGLTIEAGTPKPLVIPFQLCTTRGCQAVAGVEKGFLDTFAKTDKATAKFVIINGREITINVSVKGLPDALAQLEAH